MMNATLKGDLIRTAKVTGVIQKEASRKRLRVINASTRRVRRGSMVSMKVPTADGGHNEFRTKDGVFNAVSPIILERFQSALVARCH